MSQIGESRCYQRLNNLTESFWIQETAAHFLSRCLSFSITLGQTGTESCEQSWPLRIHQMEQKTSTSLSAGRLHDLLQLNHERKVVSQGRLRDFLH